MAEQAKPAVKYTIGGVKVEFPVKAYPSQISMMDKVCIALIRRTVLLDKDRNLLQFFSFKSLYISITFNSPPSSIFF